MRDREPTVIWEALAQIHIARDFATWLALRRQFSRLVKDTKESMVAWIGRVKSFAFGLENVGVNISDEDCILALTNGLNSLYNAFVILLDVTAVDQLTLAQVTDRLLNEKVRCGNRSAIEQMDQPTVLLTNGGGGSSMVTAGPSACWRCGEVGHIKAFCKRKPEEVGNLVISDASQLRDLGEQTIGQVY